jgi:prophage regulatory protein
MMQKFMRLTDVKACVGLGRSTIYARIAQGTFPKPIFLGERAVGWLESDVTAWIDERVKESRKGGAV